LSIILKFINDFLLIPIGFLLKRKVKEKSIEERSYTSQNLKDLRNQKLADFISKYFKKNNVSFEFGDVLESINKYDEALKNLIIKNNNGGMGYNNGLITFIIFRLISPAVSLESGVWKGFTTYIIDKATDYTSEIYSFDINLGNLEYRSKKSTYFEGDIEENINFLYKKNIDIALFDDHVSHYDRISFGLKTNIDFMIADDDLSVFQIHSDGWPPITTASMIFDYENIPHKFNWVNNGKFGEADIERLNYKAITNSYIRIPYPDLFEFTGYLNASSSSFLINKKKIINFKCE